MQLNVLFFRALRVPVRAVDYAPRVHVTLLSVYCVSAMLLVHAEFLASSRVPFVIIQRIGDEAGFEVSYKLSLILHDPCVFEESLVALAILFLILEGFLDRLLAVDTPDLDYTNFELL